MMGCIVFGAEDFAREGNQLALGLVAIGLAAGAVLVRREWSDPRPLIPLDLLRIPIFTLSISTSVISFAAQMLAYVALPFLFQSVLGRSVIATGLLMTPWPIAVGIAAPFAGRLADQINAGLLGGVGLAVFAVGLFLLSRLGASPDNFDIAWRMAVCGFGFGLFQSPNNRTIVSAAPKPRSGAAGGMLATARLLGQTGGAVAVGAAFHVSGVGIAPHLLLAASIAALIAAGLSLTRLRWPRRAGSRFTSRSSTSRGFHRFLPWASAEGVTALDIFVFLLLFGGAAVGFVRGFVHEVISLFAWIVAIAMLKLFHSQLWTGIEQLPHQLRGCGGARLRAAVHP